MTPFDYTPLVVYPLFAVRTLLAPLNRAAGIQWHRYFHYVILKKMLGSRKFPPKTTIFAQCPLSAQAALECKQSSSLKVVLAIRFNHSQADEYVMSGKIREETALYNQIKKTEKTVLPRVDALMFVSDYMKKYLSEAIPEIKDINSTVIPNFLPAEQTHRPDQRGDCIAVGTLEPRKNQAYLLHVIARAQQKGKKYTLTLMGDGPDRRRLLSLAKRLNISDQVIFKGYIRDAASYMKNYKILVHSAIRETFGTVIMEAFASGIPVMAAGIGGIPELLEHDVQGCHWPLDNPDKGADLLIKVLETPHLYADLSNNAYQKYQESFTAEKVSEQLYDFLSAV